MYLIYIIITLFPHKFAGLLLLLLLLFVTRLHRYLQ
jgi:hypothetical protein